MNLGPVPGIMPLAPGQRFAQRDASAWVAARNCQTVAFPMLRHSPSLALALC